MVNAAPGRPLTPTSVLACRVSIAGEVLRGTVGGAKLTAGRIPSPGTLPKSSHHPGQYT